MKVLFIGCAASALVACGGGAIPTAKMTEAKADIKAAEAVGAAEVPQAALHLKLARDEVKRAEAFVKDGDGEEANLVLDNARVDAELALTLAKGSQARAKAIEAVKEVNDLSRQ